jgi:hypothetical protein
MNDPGLEEPTANDAKDVENQKHDENEEEDQTFLEPRYVNHCQSKIFHSLLFLGAS